MSLSKPDYQFSVYITPNLDDVYGLEASVVRPFPKVAVENVIKSTNPIGKWNVTATSCGLIASFTHQKDVNALLSLNLATALGGPVHAARFSALDAKYTQVLILRDVPRAIPLQDIDAALRRQGITVTDMYRARQNIKVVISDPIYYENLLLNGLNFFDTALFIAVPDKWRTQGLGRNNLLSSSENSILQCYKCQGFWHVAANCRHIQRCVRCGDAHHVNYCLRPRNDPICCHCYGPHHAAHKFCPVRLQLANSTPVSVIFSSQRLQSKTPRNDPPP